MSYTNPWALAPGLEDDAAVVEQVQFNISETHDEDGIPLEYTDSDTGEVISEPIEAVAAEAELEVAEAEDVVEKLQETSEDLESHLLGIESRINSEEGLTANEVDTMLVGLRRTFPNIASINPGTESFNRNRLVASNEVKERIVGGLKAIWEKIKAAIEKLRTKMTEWFNKLLSKAAGVKRKVQAVKKKAQNVKGSPEDDTIEISGISDTLADSSGRYPADGQAVIKQIRALNDVASFVLEPVNKTNRTVLKNFKDEIKKLVDDAVAQAEASQSSSASVDDKTVTLLFLKSASTINQLPSSPAAKTYDISRDARFEGADMVTRVEFPGNKALFYCNGSAAVNKNNGSVTDLTRHYALMGPTFDTYDNVSERKIEAKEDFAVIRNADVSVICDECIGILDTILRFNNEFSNIKSLGKDLQKEIDKAVDKSEKSKAFKDKAEFKVALQKTLNGQGTFINKTNKTMPAVAAYLLKLINNYMLWCTRSLSNYKLD